MVDIFDNKIICSKCDLKMQREDFEKDGFILRSVICPNCQQRIIHPFDKEEYEKFISLKNKEFRVKMRIVGNSYAISIPKEIVSFMNEINKNNKRIMDEMVSLCLEEFGKLTLNFEKEFNTKINELNNIKKSRK